MDWKDVGNLLYRIMLLLFAGILGITLMHFYPLIGWAGVCTFAVLLSLCWPLACLAAGVVKLIGKIQTKLLMGTIALFLLLHQLLDEITLPGHLLLTGGVLLLAFVLTIVWLQELRYWTNFGLKGERLTHFGILAGLLCLSFLVYAFSAKHKTEHGSSGQKAQSGGIRQLYYGSGNDKRRPEFTDSITYVTPRVDAGHLLSNWSGFHGYIRNRFWGFGPESLPLNGRVWYAAGEGKKPLVLMVHGNHLDQDFSDGGFAYLGEYLASQGFIAVSVDENFLNSSWSDILDGIQGDIPARAWLLLRHLQVWQAWNHSPGNEFYGRVDMSRIALIGHSRGGEAVAWAQYMNTLPYTYNKPEELNQEPFSIKAIIGITPTDGYRLDEGSLLHLTNVHYLHIGSGRDMDLLYYSGQYGRLSFTDTSRYIKARLILPDGNHNQFNQAWDRHDVLFPNSLFASLQDVMPPAEQQNAAKASILAFLRSSFEGNTSYTDWFSSQPFPGQYQYSDASSLATFDEDQNLRSGTYPHALIRISNADSWKEKELFAARHIANGRALHLTWGEPSPGTPLTLQIDSLHIPCHQAALTFDIGLAEAAGVELLAKVTDTQGNTAVHPVDIRKVLTSSSGKTKTSFSLFEQSAVEPIVFQTVRIPLPDQTISAVTLILKASHRGSIWIDSIQLQHI